MLHSGIIDQAGRTLPRWSARSCTDATATFARISIDAGRSGTRPVLTGDYE